MSHPYVHAQKSVRKWGGKPEDYLALHNFFDLPSKGWFADFRHRAFRHHSEGIAMLEEVFGTTITNSTGREVPVRHVGEQHVKEDCGRIPTAADWFRRIQPERWMAGVGKPEPERRKPVAVVDTYASEVLERFDTVAEAEALIAELEKTEPEKVHAGGYGIDAPEEMSA